MTREELLEIGFEEIPHFTVGHSMIYHLKRSRHISISCIGTPNEMVFLCETNSKNPKAINELIVLRNYDYDGYTSIEWISNLIKLLS